MQKSVIYTAIFGNHEFLREPRFRPPGCDFLCFTDTALKSRTWDVKIIARPHADPRRAARKVKILAHQFLADYDRSIWVDGNLIVRGDVNFLIEKYLHENNLAVFDHSQTARDPAYSVAQETRCLIERTKRGKFEDDPDLIMRQFHAYQAEGFPDDQGLASTMAMLRNHHSPDVIKTMELWWEQIEKWTRRDQMSFNYAAWKTGLRFRYISGDSRNNPYFTWVPHEDIPYLTRKWHKIKKLFR